MYVVGDGGGVLTDEQHSFLWRKFWSSNMLEIKERESKFKRDRKLYNPLPHWFSSSHLPPADKFSSSTTLVMTTFSSRNMQDLLWSIKQRSTLLNYNPQLWVKQPFYIISSTFFLISHDSVKSNNIFPFKIPRLSISIYFCLNRNLLSCGLSPYCLSYFRPILSGTSFLNPSMITFMFFTYHLILSIIV